MNICLLTLSFDYLFTHSFAYSFLAPLIGNKIQLHASSTTSSNIMIEFQPANKTVSAIIGDDISEVALANEVDIPYQCRKGECGTCLINMDGKWVKACQVLTNSLTLLINCLNFIYLLISIRQK